mmetsp:Transcript_686/g.1421  ORF Transcript_686/g.1421 Transcript_686/m.1421 type:complete len:278 (-) Transcript_686:132-965(-)
MSASGIGPGHLPLWLPSRWTQYGCAVTRWRIRRRELPWTPQRGGGLSRMDLLPPGSRVRAEVLLSPWLEYDVVASIDFSMGERQRQWGRPTDDFARLVVLGSMAGAHEFVLGRVPRNHAPKVSAHGVQCVVLNIIIFGRDEIVRITLESLYQLPRTWWMGLQPLRLLHILAQSILGHQTTTHTPGTLRQKEVGICRQNRRRRYPYRARQQQVHGNSLVHIRNFIRRSRRRRHHPDRRPTSRNLGSPDTTHQLLPIPPPRSNHRKSTHKCHLSQKQQQ